VTTTENLNIHKPTTDSSLQTITRLLKIILLFSWQNHSELPGSVFEMAILRRCCCCFTLRRGTITLGVMGFTGSITALITLSLGITFVESIASAVIDAMGLVIDIPYAQGTRHLDEEGQQQKVQELHDFLVNAYSNYIFVGALIGTIIGGIFAAMVVYGAVKKNKNFLLPWLIFETMVIIGTAVCILICMVLLYRSVTYSIITFIVGMLELGEHCFNQLSLL